jgi:acetyltransferase-like isoleucine patch superfamily enzyme
VKRLFNFHRYPLYVKKLYWAMTSSVMLKQNGISRSGPVECIGLPIIRLAKDSQLILGARLNFSSDSKHTDLGVSRPVILRTLLPDAIISVGDDTGLSGTTICAAQSIRIGKRCLIGADVLIVDTDFHPLASEGRRHNGPSVANSRPVEIEDDVFIGARSMILKGVKIGTGSVVGAGSVVTSEVPAGVVVAGNPAKFIRNIPCAGDQ